MSNLQVLLLEGDGIGPEVVCETTKVMELFSAETDLSFEIESAEFGGASIDAFGVPLTDSVVSLAKEADAVLLGAVGGPKWDEVASDVRPERGLLSLRAQMGVFANLRPARFFESLAASSPLRPELIEGVEFIFVRELTGGIYFGEPRGVSIEDGIRRGVSSMVYDENEIRRVGKIAFEIARKRKKRLVSVDKANVLEVQRLWREVITEQSAEYPDVELEHYYVDNCAMQLVTGPAQFDVVVTGNMFGDILSDAAAAMTGSLGMLPSASVGVGGGLFEPVHGSAPDIAGLGKANPLAAILSFGMMLEYSAGRPELARVVHDSVDAVLGQGLRTPDIASVHYNQQEKLVGTREMGEAVLRECRAHLARL